MHACVNVCVYICTYVCVYVCVCARLRAPVCVKERDRERERERELMVPKYPFSLNMVSTAQFTFHLERLQNVRIMTIRIYVKFRKNQFIYIKCSA